MPINGVCYCGGEGWDGCEPRQSAEPAFDPSVLRAAVASDAELLPSLFDSIWGDWERGYSPTFAELARPAAEPIDPRLLTSGQRLSLPGLRRSPVESVLDRTPVEVGHE